MLEKIIRQHSFSDYKLGDFPEFVQALLEVKEACALANEKAEVILTSKKIIQATKKIKDEINPQNFPVDIYQGGGGIAVNVNINENIAQTAGISQIDCNASQSTADVCATALRIMLLRSWGKFNLVLQNNRSLMKKKSQEFYHVQTLSRTCLQDALPVSLGLKFLGYEKNIARRTESLEQSVKSLKKVSLGGTVIGTGEGAPAAYRKSVVKDLNEVTKLPLVQRENLADAAQNVDEIAEVSAQLHLIAESLIKVCKDLRLLHSGPEGGFGEIVLPKAMSGSSFFAEKNNPTVVETLLQCCFQVLGFHRTVMACVEHGELDLNTFELMAGLQVQKMMIYLSKALHNFNEYALKDLKANEQRCHQLSTKAKGQKNADTTS